MSQSQLPIELWQAICRQCEPVDVRNLRGACRVLRDAGDELLLDAVTPYYHRRDLERLRDITKASLSIRKGIERFTFFLDRLEPFRNFDAWDEVRGDVFNGNDYLATQLIEDRSQKDEHPHEIRKTEMLRQFRDENMLGKRKPFGPLMHERYRRYCELIEYQSELERGSNLREMLFAFFKACPNLRCLEFCIKAYLHARMLDETFQSGLVIPRGASDDGNLAFKETILAAYDAKFQPKQLTILHLHQCISLFDDAFLEKASRVLQNVTALHWSFELCAEHGGPWFDIDSFNDGLAGGKLVTFLHSCPRLESLDLIGPERENPSQYPDMPPIRHMVGTLFWPRLSKLTFSFLQVTSQDLAELLLRHADSLTELTLGDMYILDVDWARCFTMFAGKLTALKVVHLRNGFHASVHDFTDYFFLEDPQSGVGHNSEPFVKWILHGGKGPPYPPGQLPEEDED